MFTDIYGFYAVVDEDWRQALKLLKKNRKILTPLVKAHNGIWLKEIEDGQLSRFKSAIDAVNCALEIQRTFGKDTDLTLRIGIHFGYIVIAKEGIFGNGPNVARRIEPLAEPGGICISEQVYDAVRDNPDIKPVFIGKKS
ncbi:MAG: adenylate/guanylate cyclase domain-containing protein [Candidatus Marinimicrobia bacterium]|nr:adenylate/guanylate cyclase domain-containing protein [Candidatus Neomarinimicrobiota bacterium]